MPVDLYMDHHVAHPITVGLRVRGVSVLGECIDHLEMIAKASELAEMRNRVLYLPL